MVREALVGTCSGPALGGGQEEELGWGSGCRRDASADLPWACWVGGFAGVMVVQGLADCPKTKVPKDKNKMHPCVSLGFLRVLLSLVPHAVLLLRKSLGTCRLFGALSG